MVLSPSHVSPPASKACSLLSKSVNTMAEPIQCPPGPHKGPGGQCPEQCLVWRCQNHWQQGHQTVMLVIKGSILLASQPSGPRKLHDSIVDAPVQGPDYFGFKNMNFHAKEAARVQVAQCTFPGTASPDFCCGDARVGRPHARGTAPQP